jgi:hypothetical protein
VALRSVLTMPGATAFTVSHAAPGCLPSDFVNCSIAALVIVVDDALRVRGLRHAGGDGDYPATARHALQRELGELERIARVDREDVLQLLAGDDVDRSLEDDAGVY